MDTKLKRNVAMAAETHKKLKAYADKNGHNIRWVLAQAVEAYLKANAK